MGSEFWEIIAVIIALIALIPAFFAAIYPLIKARTKPRIDNKPDLKLASIIIEDVRTYSGQYAPFPGSEQKLRQGSPLFKEIKGKGKFLKKENFDNCRWPSLLMNLCDRHSKPDEIVFVLNAIKIIIRNNGSPINSLSIIDGFGVMDHDDLFDLNHGFEFNAIISENDIKTFGKSQIISLPMAYAFKNSGQQQPCVNLYHIAQLTEKNKHSIILYHKSPKVKVKSAKGIVAFEETAFLFEYATESSEDDKKAFYTLFIDINQKANNILNPILKPGRELFDEKIKKAREREKLNKR